MKKNTKKLIILLSVLVALIAIAIPAVKVFLPQTLASALEWVGKSSEPQPITRYSDSIARKCADNGFEVQEDFEFVKGYSHGIQNKGYEYCFKLSTDEFEAFYPVYLEENGFEEKLLDPEFDSYGDICICDEFQADLGFDFTRSVDIYSPDHAQINHTNLYIAEYPDRDEVYVVVSIWDI